MKRKETYALIVFLLLFPFLTFSTASAQSGLCDCNGNGGPDCEVLITSQVELDALVSENCSAILGSLIISSPDLTNIDGLESIGLIGWNLIITENEHLASIAGLVNIQRTTGDVFEISWNPSLDDLTPLYGTNVVGNYLEITNNQILSMAEAFALLIQLSPPNGIFNGTSLITDNGLVDTDGDGILDGDDICPNDAANDADGDGYCADDDNCPDNCNTQQLDQDGDGYGDVCDPGERVPGKGCSDGCGSPVCEQEC